MCYRDFSVHSQNLYIAVILTESKLGSIETEVETVKRVEFFNILFYFVASTFWMHEEVE